MSPVEERAAEITLKLRMPDLFVVAATKLPGRHPNAETSFEEDIAPLEVAISGSRVKVADPPSIRSRFALSTKQPVRGDPETLEDAFNLYPALADNLRRAKVEFARSASLLSGPAIREQVYEGPGVALGSGVVAEVVLTLWELAAPARVRNVAEISYRCGTIKGRMPRKAAREALDLFLDLQTGLGDCVELRYPSKTALALPNGGGRPTKRARAAGIVAAGSDDISTSVT